MKERFEISDAIEQLTVIVDEADVDSVLDMYKLLCDPTAVLVEEDDEYFIEITTRD